MKILNNMLLRAKRSNVFIKVVMFGLDLDALRKQFGELFLARRQSEAFFGANGSSGYTKRAAMFGLDARIALAIFGALSVISGAALYSAIQQAKVVQWQTYFNELTKASEAYYLDTGREIPLTSSTSADDERLYLSINDLAINEDNVLGWNGPYWQVTEYYTGTNDSLIKDNQLKMIDENSNLLSLYAYLRQESNWNITSGQYIYSDELCVLNSSDCAEWWVINGSVSVGSKTSKLFDLLDSKIDGSDGSQSGSIRYFDHGLSNYLLVKGRSRVYK